MADLKAYLTGAWKVSRRIDDQRRGESGVFDGEAAFVAEKGGLRYRERGLLRLGDFESEGSRGYVYAFPAPAVADIFFEDGRFFHTLDLSGGAWSANHPCGDDGYNGDFIVTSADRWRVVWRVTGPRKALVLDTEYRRDPA